MGMGRLRVGIGRIGVTGRMGKSRKRDGRYGGGWKGKDRTTGIDDEQRVMGWK